MSIHPVFSSGGSPLPPDKAAPHIAAYAAEREPTPERAANLALRMMGQQLIAYASSWDLGVTMRVQLDHLSRGLIFSPPPAPSVALPILALPEGVALPKPAPPALLRQLAHPVQPTEPAPAAVASLPPAYQPEPSYAGVGAAEH